MHKQSESYRPLPTYPIPAFPHPLLQLYTSHQPGARPPHLLQEPPFGDFILSIAENCRAVLQVNVTHNCYVSSTTSNSLPCWLSLHVPTAGRQQSPLPSKPLPGSKAPTTCLCEWAKTVVSPDPTGPTRTPEPNRFSRQTHERTT